MKKIAIVGSQGVGKTTICKKVSEYLFNNVFDKNLKNYSKNYHLINEVFLDLFQSLSDDKCKISGHRSENFDLNKLNKKKEMTIATYSKQLYLENYYSMLNKNIICDRSVLDTFIYYLYYSKTGYKLNDHIWYTIEFAYNYLETYDKIFLIEPSNRVIEKTYFRSDNKKIQSEIHNIFLEYLKDFKNVEIINQEKQDKIVEKCINVFNI